MFAVSRELVGSKTQGTHHREAFPPFSTAIGAGNRLLRVVIVTRNALNHRHAAVHVQRLPRDIGGLVGRQIDGGGGDFLARAQSA